MTKSAHTRASLLPYPIIAAAVAGDAEAVSRVVRHYSSYIAALSTRTSYCYTTMKKPRTIKCRIKSTHSHPFSSHKDNRIERKSPGHRPSPIPTTTTSYRPKFKTHKRKTTNHSITRGKKNV